jgi:hypothetical protein
MSRNVYIVNFGAVEYYDLCQYQNVSREEFFKDCDLKSCTVYGLIHEVDDLVKVLWETDDSDDTECGGIVIPKSCVVKMTIFQSEQDYDLNDSEDVSEIKLPPIKNKKMGDAN